MSLDQLTNKELIELQKEMQKEMSERCYVMYTKLLPLMQVIMDSAAEEGFVLKICDRENSITLNSLSQVDIEWNT